MDHWGEVHVDHWGGGTCGPLGGRYIGPLGGGTCGPLGGTYMWTTGGEVHVDKCLGYCCACSFVAIHVKPFFQREYFIIFSAIN